MTEPQTEQVGPLARYCEPARKAAREAVAAPVHERGVVLAWLANHLRECATCASAKQRPSAREAPAQNWNPNTCAPECDWCEACDWCLNLPSNRPGLTEPVSGATDDSEESSDDH